MGNYNIKLPLRDYNLTEKTINYKAGLLGTVLLNCWVLLPHLSQKLRVGLKAKQKKKEIGNKINECVIM